MFLSRMVFSFHRRTRIFTGGDHVWSLATATCTGGRHTAAVGSLAAHRRYRRKQHRPTSHVISFRTAAILAQPDSTTQPHKPSAPPKRTPAALHPSPLQCDCPAIHKLTFNKQPFIIPNNAVGFSQSLF